MITKNTLFLLANRIYSAFGLTLLVLSMMTSSARSQDSTARPDRGTGGSATQAASGIDNINMQNGNVSMQVPLASLPPIAGGKLSYTLNAYYNSTLWNNYKSEARGASLQGCPSSYTTDSIDLADNGGWRIGGQYQIIFRPATEDYNYLLPPDNGSCYGNEFYLMTGQFFKPILKMPDGSEHEMRINASPAFPVYTGNNEFLMNYYRYQGSNGLPFDAQIRLYTVDGTFITATYDPTGSYTIYLKDGTKVQPATGGGQRITDPNGNSILITDSDAKDEQTNREIKWSVSTYNGSSATKVEYQTIGGVWETVWVVWGTTTPKGILYTTKDWDQNRLPNGSTCNKQVKLNGAGATDENYNAIAVIRQIILPATEQGVQPQQYSFAYDSDTSTSMTTNNVSFQCVGSPAPAPYTRAVSGFGEVSQVTTPTGSQINYIYANYNFNGYYSNSDLLVKNPLLQKQIVHDGATDLWNYTVPTGTLNTTSSLSNPDGSTYAESYYPTDPLRTAKAGTSGLGGLTYRTNQSGKILTEKHWTLLGGAGLVPFGSGSGANHVSFNPVVDTEYTTLLADDGVTRLKMTAKKYQYDYNGNLTQTIDYDWFDPGAVSFSNDSYALPTNVPASAAVLRTVNNAYYNPAADASSSYAYQNRTVGASTIILGAVQDTSIANTNSTSHFSYDGQSYGTAPTKGNLTGVSVYNDTNSQWITSSVGYDTYGNVTSKTDGKVYTTQIYYDDSTHAMPTRTVVDPQNGTGQQTSSATYDFSTGAVLTKTDANGNASSISYTNLLLGAVDPFGRPGTVYSPYVTIDGVSKRQTSKTYYEDYARKTRVESDLFNEGDGLVKARETRDQLGRPVLSEKNENGASGYTISSETVYNSPQNHAVMSSNPHRSAAAATDGWTIAKTDILGRAIEAATFSGAAQPTNFTNLSANANWTGSVTTAYSANQTTVTDQAGKQRRSIVNALGQLSRVDEPNDSGQLDVSGVPAQSTGYVYDLLGNLTTVTQGAQARTFQYDSLSRLKQATNPESGTINYTYDNNSNLLTKTDARSVVTTYGYDALNRVISRGYSAPANLANYQAAPTVAYTYDNLTNAKGKLTKVTNGFSTTDYTGFDSFGRVTSSQQTTDTVVYPAQTYSYYLSGALNEEKYPSGRVVKNVLDNSGDLSIVQSKKNLFAGYWNYADHFTHTAAGAVSSMQLGNGKWESTSFNSRLQPTQIALGSVQNGTDNLKLVYDYGSMQNNGNVQSQTITVPTVGSTPGFVATQNYTYDSLNRLKSAAESIGGSQSWKQTFTYDRYGNRNFDTNGGNTTTLGTCSQAKCNPTIDTTNNNNRFTTAQGYTYDLSGNLVGDTNSSNRTFVYDGENKQKSVSDSSGSLGTYYYDGDGKRVEKVVGTETTILVYDASGKMVAEYATTLSTTPQVSYLTSDNLRTPRINTNANGAVIARHDYMPFGEEITSLITSVRDVNRNYGDEGIRQKFTSYEKDPETDLQYSWARYYSTLQGRFQVPDPYWGSALSVNPQTWNRYVYSLNNPLEFTDPLGLTWLSKSGTYYWVDDKDYEKNQKYYEDNKYVVEPIGTIIHLAGKQDRDDAKKFADKWVRLGDNNSLSQVESSGEPLPENASIEPTVLRCKMPTAISGLAFFGTEHHWIKTDKKEVGAGQDPNDPRNADHPWLPFMTMTNETGDSFLDGAHCELVTGVDVNIVNSQLKIGERLPGRFFLGNNCQTTVDRILTQAEPLPAPKIMPVQKP